MAVLTTVVALRSFVQPTAAEAHTPPLVTPADLASHQFIKHSVYLAEDLPGEARMPLAIGSGLTPIARFGETVIVVSLTDRGPNAALDSKPKSLVEKIIFPRPHFNPVLVPLAISNGKLITPNSKQLWESPLHTTSTSPIPLKDSAGALASGLPPPYVREEPVDTTLTRVSPAVGAAEGLDPEAITFDARRGMLWIAEEYSPSLISVDPATGRIVKRRTPGDGLPRLLSQRVPNRGFEAVTYTPSDYLWAILQSPIREMSSNLSEHFVRLVAIPADPQSTVESKTFAIPLPMEAEAESFKIGDVAALSDSRFLALEAYKAKDGEKHHHLILLDTSKAGEIDSEHVITSSKINGAVTTSILFDFKDLQWNEGKIEGLAVIDDRTLLISKDNDFGISVEHRSGKNRKAKQAPGPKVHFDDIPTELLLLTFQESLRDVASRAPMN
jgi:hypothetical protein